MASGLRPERAQAGWDVSYWTYDAQTQSQYTGQRGTEYTVSRTVMVDEAAGAHRNPRALIKCARSVQRFFDDVLVLASKACRANIPKGWSLGTVAVAPYQPKYLAGSGQKPIRRP